MAARRKRRHRAVAKAAVGVATIGPVEAKLFMNGRSQAVRLPAAYRFPGRSVWVKKWRGTVVLLSNDDPWRPLIESVGGAGSEFLRERESTARVDMRPDLEGIFD